MNNRINDDSNFNSFLKNFAARLIYLFHEREDINELSLKRGLPPYILREIMAMNPLAYCIPASYGGKAENLTQSLRLASAAAYESLALSLMIGINFALFLEPLIKYAEALKKQAVIDGFLKYQKMGGLMITEPDYGSDAFNMQTFWQKCEGKYHLEGIKHWAGLTGWADYWLLTARNKKNNSLGRDIDFFVCNMSEPDEQIKVKEKYNNLGLYMIPYGLNEIDVDLPENSRLIPETSGMRMMLDILHRSRMQFPGMALGFIQRILDEALKHCTSRYVGKKQLIKYDRVQEQLVEIQNAFVVSSAFSIYSAKNSDINNDLSEEGIIANAIKAYLSDLMQESAQVYLQLSGAKGYRLNSLAGRSVIDSRPFQIFEGANDMLYAQITDLTIKKMKKEGLDKLSDFIKCYYSSGKLIRSIDKISNFAISDNLVQRKKVCLGKLISRLIAFVQVSVMGNKGFSNKLIKLSQTYLEKEILKLKNENLYKTEKNIVDDYKIDCLWFNYI